MLSSEDIRPKWWQLYLTFPLLVALFVLDHRLKISARGHLVVQIGILMIIYGLVHLWLKANAYALANMDLGQDHGKITVIRISQLPDADQDKRSMFRLPDSEIKGMLSDTFEMDYIDAKFVPSNEVPEESDKE
jgi:hypothetical protein